ncbi:MAG TPA: hypothetical protein VHY20_05835 [Pirellulales bacterium]|nr:hypothetical protein [Pirellulales bacterium]
MHQLVGPKTELLAVQADDTGTARLHHFHDIPAAQAELFKPLHLLGLSDDDADFGSAARWQAIERNQIVHHGIPLGMRAGHFDG